MAPPVLDKSHHFCFLTPGGVAVTFFFYTMVIKAVIICLEISDIYFNNNCHYLLHIAASFHCLIFVMWSVEHGAKDCEQFWFFGAVIFKHCLFLENC
jgi:hypothetical protein